MRKNAMGSIIAEAVFRFPDAMRQIRRGKRTARIAIGRPRRDTKPRGDWICPIRIEGFTPGVVNAHGVGSLDALLNAMTLLNQFLNMCTLACLAPKGTRQPARSRPAQGRTRRI